MTVNKRSEDELRAAFGQKATEAPPAADVLRAVRARQAAPRIRRRVLVPALVGAAAIAVGVPLGISLSQSSGTGTHSGPNGAAAAGGPQTTAGAASAGSAAVRASSAAQPRRATPGLDRGNGSSSAGGPGADTATSSSATSVPPGAATVCQPGEVTAIVQPDVGADGLPDPGSAVLSITAHGIACRLVRVPSVQAQPDAVPAAPVGASGTLAAGATARATLHWSDGCAAAAGSVLRVDWGAGPVAVHVAAAAGSAPRQACPTAPSASATAGPFTGLR